MTREEAIEILYQYSVRDMTYPKEDIEAFEIAIKALEQEPILDKIMADIGSSLSEEVLDDNRHLISDIGIGLEIALGIIDKYKAESGED